ncbi:NUDIX domain-containing protein [Halobellus ordinarius]|uniref:NUDIX domain-containing protein n=1 Tax=Halobellus ordinarius TaxID=3075120 RepID=UPI002880AEA5|nr:NUDIX domain-containing protein [Halobellus sp. ZY16]
MADVVTCFVRERGEILLTRRSDAVGTYQGRWAGVSGYVEGDPADAERDARRELREEVALTDADLELVRVGEPLAVDDAEGSFTVHPFLFETGTRSVTTNEELAAIEWVDPTEIRHRETVPRLWATWRRVAPTVETVREDRTHGSAWIAARALEVLRDAAVDADEWDDVAETVRDLRDARPGMAAVENRVNRVLAEVTSSAVTDSDQDSASTDTLPDPDAVVDRAIDALAAAFDADTEAAETAVQRLQDAEATAVATLSRSGTIRESLAALSGTDEDDPDSGDPGPSPSALVVAESRPEGEGVGVAEWAARETDASVTLTTEAALPSALATHDVDAVLVGADSIAPTGDVVNKTGTRVLALAAREIGIPVYVVAAADKIRAATDGKSGRDSHPAETSPTDAVYDGDADIAVHAPTFEEIPADLIDGVATDAGLLDASAVREVAERHAEYAAWDS